jgi:hypothetical protein
VDLDATIGDRSSNYTTVVTLIQNSLIVEGCTTGIPLSYTLTNLPLDTPIVFLQSSHSGFYVPECAQYWGLNIFTSKGFTIRHVSIQWSIGSMIPENDDLKV